MTNKIRVAIVGVGNCAKSLVEGVEFYSRPENFDMPGIQFWDIGGYKPEDIEFVVGFDVDERKIGKPINEAIYENPNCAMDIVSPEEMKEIPSGKVYAAPLLDGVAPHMLDLPDNITFKPASGLPESGPISAMEISQILRNNDVDVIINYLPVGSEEGTMWWVQRALGAGCHFVNCIPTLIDTQTTMEVEQAFIDAGLTFVGSDMRSQFGASRLSEVLQGALTDAGLFVTQHIQENKACGASQGKEHIMSGVSANTDFANMAAQDRLKGKHISKENVLVGQEVVRGNDVGGRTMYAGPSLTVFQRPGGEYIGSDNKVANLDIIAFGFGGARYELTARLSVQDSPNSAGVVISAIRFCRVASEMDIVGYLRGPSAYTQKTPPVQMTSQHALEECYALANRELTDITKKQCLDLVGRGNIKVDELKYTFQDIKTAYE